jgi:hypothetical protein
MQQWISTNTNYSENNHNHSIYGTYSSMDGVMVCVATSKTIFNNRSHQAIKKEAIRWNQRLIKDVWTRGFGGVSLREFDARDSLQSLCSSHLSLLFSLCELKRSEGESSSGAIDGDVSDFCQRIASLTCFFLYIWMFSCAICAVDLSNVGPTCVGIG